VGAQQATTNQPFTGTVATFTDADPNGTVSDYTATITWGDGNMSAGVVSADVSTPGQFDVTGTHTYATDGQRTVTVAIADAGGATTSGGTTITSSTPSFTVTLLPASTEALAGGSATLTATVTNATTHNPVAGALVTFTVTGKNPGAPGSTCLPAGCTTDASGHVAFTYPDTNGVGTDTVTATFSNQHASATVIWAKFVCSISKSGNTATETVRSAVGLKSDAVKTSTNVTTTVDAFTVGTTNPVTAHFTDTTASPGSFLVKWTDTAGNFTYCASGPIQFGGTP
jgi:hypothetical protein